MQAARPADAHASRPPTNLPHHPSSFVGRELEIAELRHLLGATRLLTLTGAGGVGKTRLAIETAWGLRDRYPDGVWLAELAGLADPEFIAPEIAAILGLPEQPAQPALAVLTDYLRSRQLLLLVDNCEHLVDQVAMLVSTLLRLCPGLRVFTTSREALRVDGEVDWRVPSLTLPDRWAPSRPLDELGHSEAVQLLLARAASAFPSFCLTEENAAAVVQICNRLDGIPLAIELAAARIKVLSVDQIAVRLDDLFDLLTAGSRTALPRQQTLRATIEWSYDLLSEAEQRLFNRLSVFAEGGLWKLRRW